MKKVIIVGAGEAGEQLYNLIKTKEEIIGFLDDYKTGDKIIGKIEDYLKICNNYSINKIYFSIPSIDNKEILNTIIKYSNEKNIEVKIIPSIIDIIEGEVKADYIRDVKFEDLLFRPIRKSNIKISKEFLKGKVVLVTGAAGSIGSELVKQLILYGSNKVIGIDHSELGIFNQMKKYGLLTGYGDKKEKLFFHIKSIRDRKGLDYIFKRYSPDIVFNAAAYKHVYQMELNPDEAIKTDIIGLKNIIDVSINNNVKHFCQISTDKAVNPTNIMGASKRIGELLIHYYSKVQSDMKLNAVRFGNVLGSSGSVLTIFDEQIKKREDITVTDKEVVRYFMSVDEAVNLVITSTTLDQNGKIFVLDMGDPIKIYDLAKKFIELSNAKGINIKIIGLKTGEKLYEELILDKSKDIKTIIDKIFITEDKGNYQNILNEINSFIDEYNKNNIIKILKEIIPEFNHIKK